MTTVAIKVIDMSINQNNHFVRTVAREIEVLYLLANLKNNIYTIQLKDAWIDTDGTKVLRVYLVTDFYKMSLAEFL